MAQKGMERPRTHFPQRVFLPAASILAENRHPQIGWAWRINRCLDAMNAGIDIVVAGCVWPWGAVKSRSYDHGKETTDPGSAAEDDPFGCHLQKQERWLAAPRIPLEVGTFVTTEMERVWNISSARCATDIPGEPLCRRNGDQRQPVRMFVMDPVSHALLGATAAAVFQPREHLRVAAVVGGLAALLADLDVLIRSAEDPLMQLEYHRQFTHALLFTPVGGLVAALLLYRWTRRRLSFRQSWTMASLGYLTAGPLDACTSYGTQLLWPWSDTRFAWSILPVVEPVTTLLLMVLLHQAVRCRKRRWLVAAVAGLGCWFSVAAWQQQRAVTLAQMWARERGDVHIDLRVKPTMMNLVLWRAVYRSGDRIQAVAVRPGVWGAPTLYPGESAPWIRTDQPLPGIPETSRLAQDLRRFDRLSDRFMVVHPERSDLFGDGRYALLPHAIAPLWGIVVDPDKPDRPAPFDEFRMWQPDTARTFWAMLLGRPVKNGSG
ncbi:MAG: metal-dependent hydrolase [Magnetococcales bacterium]|nr:metal-dependent hydrolase [Magnetococcales bacterium]MBF0149394.1 metal-dependent hydrolase [Magnetococcales bacterium]